MKYIKSISCMLAHGKMWSFCTFNLFVCLFLFLVMSSLDLMLTNFWVYSRLVFICNSVFWFVLFMSTGARDVTSTSRQQRCWMSIFTRTCPTRTPARKPRRSWPRNVASLCLRSESQQIAAAALSHSLSRTWRRSLTREEELIMFFLSELGGQNKYREQSPRGKGWCVKRRQEVKDVCLWWRFCHLYLREL